MREIENFHGGIANAKSGCDILRNRQQVYNINHAKKKVPTINSDGLLQADVLSQVMLMCKDDSNSFVRAVEAAPEPMCILATDQQLLDMERFCTGDESCVVSVDPTFNLGPFSVTPITYSNLLVTTKTDSHPILLGPVIIHQTKKLRPFHYFESTLLRLNPHLMKLKAFGTDGEPEFVKAFNMCFPKATHLRCVYHLRQNVKEKLRSLHLPQNIWKEFLADIFDTQKRSHFESGLIDASSKSDFCIALAKFKEKWDNLERSCLGDGCEPAFFNWFREYKMDDIIHCTLPEVREKAGLHDPLIAFTTNASESLNNVIKMEVEWKENKLPALIEHLKSIAEQQAAELERAAIQ